MERVVRGRKFTLSKTFYSDGVPVVPTGMPTVAIVRADGTTVTTSAVAGTGVGPYTVTVVAANNALLDTLTVTWTATITGDASTYVDTVEVAGDVLFGVTQALAVLPTATVATIADARTYAETEIEAQLGYALVPRYTLEKTTGRWCQALRVSNPYVRTIRSATVNGVALSAGQLTDLSFDANGFVTGYPWGPIAGAWGTTLNNVAIGYEHGLDTPPPGASRAALDEAVAYLGGSTANGTGGGIDPRAESVVTVDGTVRLRASTGTLLSATAADWVQANRLLVVA
jgi:hypothetical protein